MDTKLVENPDESSHSLAPKDDRLTVVTPPDIDAAPEQTVGSLLAAQIALQDILLGLTVPINDREKVINREHPGPTRSFRLERITIDFPTSDDEFQPLSATILEDADQVFEDDHRAGLVKADYSPTHSLKRLSHTTCFLAVEAWFGHKEERSAYRTAAVRALLAEPGADRSDRLVVVPQYFGALVRLRLTKARFPESEKLAQGNRWTLQLMVEARVDELMLVPRKAPVRAEARTHVAE
jgi:hypothetical protein